MLPLPAPFQGHPSPFSTGRGEKVGCWGNGVVGVFGVGGLAAEFAGVFEDFRDAKDQQQRADDDLDGGERSTDDADGEDVAVADGA